MAKNKKDQSQQDSAYEARVAETAKKLEEASKKADAEYKAEQAKQKAAEKEAVRAASQAKKAAEKAAKDAVRAEAAAKAAAEKTARIQIFQNILSKLNTQIIQELPKREKEYEQLAIAFEEERNTFQKTRGSYSQYSKHILSEIDRIQESAREKGATAKDLENYSEQVKVLSDTLEKNFQDTEERANIINQLNKTDEKLQKDLSKKKKIFSKIGSFASRHKVTASAIVAGLTMNNPLAMWGVEAIGNMMGTKKEAALKQKQFKLQELIQARSIAKSEIGVGRQLDFGQSHIESAGKRERGTPMLDELQIHTNLLRQLVGIELDKSKFDKAAEDQRQRDLEAQMASAEESKLEGAAKGNEAASGGTAWGLKPKTVKEMSAADLESALTNAEIEGSILTSIGLNLGKIKTIVMGVMSAIFSTIALSIGAGIGGLALTVKNMVDANLKSEDWGVDALSATLSQGFLPVLGAIAGLIFGWPAILIGLALGAVAQYLLPEKWKMQAAQWTQNVGEFLGDFGNRVSIVLNYVAEAFWDMIGFLDNLIVKLRLVIIKFKKGVNRITENLPYGSGAIFDEGELELSEKNIKKDLQERQKEREEAREAGYKHVADIEDVRAARGEAYVQRQSMAEIPQSVSDSAKQKANDMSSALGFNVFNPNEIQPNQYQTPAGAAETRQPEPAVNYTPSGLNVKGGEGGQAFAGGQTSSGTIALASMVSATGSSKQFTGFNDAYHAGTKSKHASGLAMDYTLKDPSSSADEKRKIESMMAQAGVKGYVQDEYTNPSPGSTGGHIHAQFASQADADKFAAYHSQQQGDTGRTLMAQNETAPQSSPQRSADMSQMASNNSQQYLASNDTNSTAKIQNSTPSSGPIVVNTTNNNGGQTQAGNNGSSRAAPRGNEPALQMCLNSDFSGSTA